MSDIKVIKKIGGWYTEEDPAVAEARAAAEKAGTHLVTDWRNTLPEDLQSDPALMDFKDLTGLAKSYVHTKKMVGADKIPIPGQDADDETWADVYNKLGRPEGPDKYAITRPEEFPDGFNYNEQLELDFRAEVHKLGLSNKQANGLWNMLQNKAIDSYKGITGKHVERLAGDEKTLKGEWGEAYDEKIKIGNKVLVAAETKLPGFSDWAKKSGLINEPKFKQFLTLLGETASEEQIGPGEPSDKLTPAEAKAKLSSIRNDKTNPKNEAYWNKRHPDHKEVVEETYNLEALTG
jgi:hypothetical protein